MNILLADADVENMKHFRLFLRTNFPESKVVGMVSAADKVMPAVKEAHPQLIIADIRLFSHLAVTLVREIHEMFPDVGFIVYGTYSDTEYMEKVMEFGVIDYMYRPVKPTDFERSVRAAAARFGEIEQFKKDRQALELACRENLEMFRDKFICNLAVGAINDDFEIEMTLRFFGLDIPKPYTVFSVRIDHFRKLVLTIDEMEKQLLVYQVLTITRGKLKAFGNGFAVIIRMNAVTGIVGGAGFDEAMALCEEIKTETIYKTKRGVTVGLGRAYERLKDIPVSFREAEAALRYRHLMGYNTVIPIHFAEPSNDITYNYPHEREEALIFAAVTGEYENCAYILRDLMNALEEDGKLPPRQMAKIVVTFVFGISRAAGERGLNVEGRFNAIFPIKEMYTLETPRAAHQFLSRALKTFCAYISQLREGGRTEIIEKVKSHIDKKYFENVSLFSMAALAGTTPEYLNVIFQKAEGMNIYDYTLKVRMDEAKRLLRETTLDDDVIAVNIGYDDVKHFRSVFRGREGIFPAQYRNSRRG